MSHCLYFQMTIILTSLFSAKVSWLLSPSPFPVEDNSLYYKSSILEFVCDIFENLFHRHGGQKQIDFYCIMLKLKNE